MNTRVAKRTRRLGTRRTCPCGGRGRGRQTTRTRRAPGARPSTRSAHGQHTENMSPVRGQHVRQQTVSTRPCTRSAAHVTEPRQLGGCRVKQSGNRFRVCTFLDFVSLSTRTPHGACAQMCGRNRFDPHGAKVEGHATRTYLWSDALNGFKVHSSCSLPPP